MTVLEIARAKPRVLTRSPFVGTRPFLRDDAPFFFGREREATRLANIVSASTMAVLYGESGVGKSSLLNARLPISLEEIEPGWSVIPFFEWQPGFESRFLQVIRDALNVTTGESFARPLLQYARDNKSPLLLILDQFEEYFLYHPNGRDVFEGELAKLINRRLSSVHVLFSLRSDGLFLLDRLRLRLPDVFAKMMLIEPLNAEAAIDCIIHPIEAFNEASRGAVVEVPERNSQLVKALVSGAEEQEIRRRLPNPGRGQVVDRTGRGSRIVAPFLQMALEAIWEEDIVRRKRRELTLTTLCDLASMAPNSQDPSQAVGQVAQEYVDSILKSFSVEEKNVCALIFERMVLPSGQKVAVKLADLKPFLPEAQKGLVEPILTRLSESSVARLIRKVAPAPGEVTAHFQIVHDAMAVPILSWVEEWRQAKKAEKAARDLAKATARERKFTLVWTCLTVVASVLFVVAIGFARVVSVTSEIDRFSSFIQRDTRPDFRLPLLLGGAGLSVARNLWWYPIDTSGLQEGIRSRLLRSPRDGGVFSAAGFDPKDSKVVLLDLSREQIVVCDLAKTTFCDTEAADSQGARIRVFPIPKPNLQMENPNPRFAQNRQYSIGFLRGVEGPVIYRAGFLHYMRKGSWQAPYDIMKALSGLDESRPGAVFVELVDGTLRVTINDWSSYRMWVAQLLGNSGDDAPVLPNKDAWRPVNWKPGSRPPIISPDALATGALSLVPAGQKADVVLKVTSDKGTVDRIVGSAKELTPAVFSLTSLGFTYDSKFLAALSATEATVVHISSNNNISNLKLADGLRPAPFLGTPFSLPPLAVAESGLDSWRLAWRTRTGIVVVHSKNGSPLVQSGQPLLPSADNLNRLTFSKDGSFLFSQSLRFETSTVIVRVWDLRPSWSQMVSSIEDDKKLQELACKVARIAASSSDMDEGSMGAVLTENEMREWGIGSQPCSRAGD
jgi:hypothetical protein